jgi:hypothetical protein
MKKLIGYKNIDYIIHVHQLEVKSPLQLLDLLVYWESEIEVLFPFIFVAFYFFISDFDPFNLYII